MSKSSELQDLRAEIKELQQTVNNCQEKVENIRAKVDISLATAIEENHNLRCRVDPFSNNGDSLADCTEI